MANEMWHEFQSLAKTEFGKVCFVVVLFVLIWFDLQWMRVFGMIVLELIGFMDNLEKNLMCRNRCIHWLILNFGKFDYSWCYLCWFGLTRDEWESSGGLFWNWLVSGKSWSEVWIILLMNFNILEALHHRCLVARRIFFLLFLVSSTIYITLHNHYFSCRSKSTWGKHKEFLWINFK